MWIRIIASRCVPLLSVLLLLLQVAGASGQKIEIVPSISHSRVITSVAVSPDGQGALTGSYDETVKLWDVSSGQLLKTFAGHSSHIAAVDFSPDGRFFISGDGNGSLKLWA